MQLKWSIWLVHQYLAVISGTKGSISPFVHSSLIDSVLKVKQSNEPEIRHETLVVSQRLLTINCTQHRLSVVINGTSPGPTLRFKPNDRVMIKVINMLPDANFTMHWHGLSMAGSPWSDGTPMISQWPIAPNASFTYEFLIRPEDAGTYFYHSHVDLQITTASGPLIIMPAETCDKSKTPFKDMIMYIQDFWYAEDKDVVNGLTSDPFVWPGSSNEVYLNGLSNGTSGTSTCAKTFPAIEVDLDTEYRLRWIHAGSVMYVSVGLSGHSLILIEVDGIDLKPHYLDHIEFAPGQRMSTILKTKNRQEVLQDGASGLYLIRLSTRWRDPEVNNFAVLRYNLSGQSKSNSSYIDMSDDEAFTRALSEYILPDATFGWQDRYLQALDELSPPDNVNNTLITLNTQQKAWGSKGMVWLTNGHAYYEANSTTGDVPYLIQLYSNNHALPSITQVESNFEIFDPVSGSYVLEAGQVVDILIKNLPSPANTSDLHPWHLHSRKFWIMAHGQGEFSEQSLQEGLFRTPYQRDMVNVYPLLGMLKPDEVGGWAMIRYQASADDAGVFPAHCHIAPHQVNGMLVIFTVAPSELPAILESYDPYSLFNGVMYGNATYTPPLPTFFEHVKVSRRDNCNR